MKIFNSWFLVHHSARPKTLRRSSAESAKWRDFNAEKL